MDKQRLIELKGLYARSLLEDVVPFWMSHGVDRQAGGFLTCLQRDGSVWSTDKPVWFMGRATWLYASLYAQVEARPEWLALARHGYDFLVRHCFGPGGKMYFSVTRDGRALQMRRYVYSEIFAVLAFAALAQATGEQAYQQRAVDTFASMQRHLSLPGLLQPKIDPATRPMKALAPLMCMLPATELLLSLTGNAAYDRASLDIAAQVLRDFVRPEDGVILETVAPDGSRIDAPEGRVMNPGHAIETAWFLLEVARRRHDAELTRRACQILDWSFERGWDREYGGLFYFIDVAGKPSPYLEHDMKLWWPHTEVLYASLLAYHMTGQDRYAAMHERVREWTFGHFPDPQFGEWYGYLRRDGSVSTTLKGNMWKGPFHIPRGLMLCWKLLREMTGS